MPLKKVTIAPELATKFPLADFSAVTVDGIVACKYTEMHCSPRGTIVDLVPNADGTLQYVNGLFQPRGCQLCFGFQPSPIAK